MIKPDIIVSWPRNCDYPLWRQFIRDNRHRFNEIIIGFTETHLGPNFISFVKQAMFPDYIHFVDIVDLPPGRDWRDFTVNNCLLHSYNAEWVWFTEQDFIITSDTFWEDVDKLSNENIVFGAYQSSRLHPCCIFSNREGLNSTSRNFGIVPDKYDHFYIFQKELEDRDIQIGSLKRGYKHLNGLSHNISLLYQSSTPNYNLDEFHAYLEDTLSVSVPIDDGYRHIIIAYLMGLERSPIGGGGGLSGTKEGTPLNGGE